MTYRFTARSVAAEADVDGEMQVGVAEEDEGFFLLFTRPAGGPSASGLPPGPGTYRVTTPDGCTAHGCVREVSLAGTLLAVSLDPECLDALELEDAEIEAVLDLPAESIDELRELLVRVLAFGPEEARPRLAGLSADSAW
ncbi:hypothetical protein [Streptomyces sanyensis]|uniref:Immunity protein 10 of polymorphic toxin system n=1 Tax=Streptomyces sanyensis TaxID=568869 RepID=A0ABP9B9R6_9ACTN